MSKLILSSLLLALTLSTGWAQTPIVIAPANVVLTGDTGDFQGQTLEQEAQHWFDGTGLSDPPIVQTGHPVPDVLPKHMYGFGSKVGATRIRSNSPMESAPELTFDLGGTYDISGILLWNHGEGEADEKRSDRGFASITISFSTDGKNFQHSRSLIFTPGPQGGIKGEYSIPCQRVELTRTHKNITHIRWNNIASFQGVPQFGYHLIGAGEIRFIGYPSAGAASPSYALLDQWKSSFVSFTPRSADLLTVLTASPTNAHQVLWRHKNPFLDVPDWRFSN